MLSNQELDCIAGMSQRRSFRAGSLVFEEGELGESLFVIISGDIEVVRRDGHGDARVIATLGPPEFFGEMSLLDKEYRSATVRAKTDAELLQLTAGDLTSFRAQYRDGFTFVVMNIARVLSTRLREANARFV